MKRGAISIPNLFERRLFGRLINNHASETPAREQTLSISNNIRQNEQKSRHLLRVWPENELLSLTNTRPRDNATAACFIRVPGNSKNPYVCTKFFAHTQKKMAVPLINKSVQNKYLYTQQRQQSFIQVSLVFLRKYEHIRLVLIGTEINVFKRRIYLV